MVSDAACPLTAQELQLAVPAAMQEVKALTGRQILAEAERAADVIGCGADILWVEKVPKKPDVAPAAVLHAINCGVAILAHRPGGVTFGGLHWCAAEHKECPGPGEWTLPGRTMSRSARGAVFTPRDLAEEVTGWALEDLVHELGPNDTADQTLWRLKPSAEILQLRVGDIACGSGIFLLCGARYLADHLVRAWFWEAAHPEQDLPPYNPITMAARRLTIRCMIGADIDPTSVELARLAVALLAPAVPIDMAKQVVCGDSLLGLSSIDQLKRFDLDPDAPLPLQPVMAPELVDALVRVESLLAKERV